MITRTTLLVSLLSLTISEVSACSGTITGECTVAKVKALSAECAALEDATIERACQDAGV